MTSKEYYEEEIYGFMEDLVKEENESNPCLLQEDSMIIKPKNRIHNSVGYDSMDWNGVN
jgi:hypothetical protein